MNFRKNSVNDNTIEDFVQIYDDRLQNEIYLLLRF